MRDLRQRIDDAFKTHTVVHQIGPDWQVVAGVLPIGEYGDPVMSVSVLKQGASMDLIADIPLDVVTAYVSMCRKATTWNAGGEFSED